jgi:hypothetical protein
MQLARNRLRRRLSCPYRAHRAARAVIALLVVEPCVIPQPDRAAADAAARQAALAM